MAGPMEGYILLDGPMRDWLSLVSLKPQAKISVLSSMPWNSKHPVLKHILVCICIGAPQTFGQTRGMWGDKKAEWYWDFWGLALTCAWCTWTSSGCLCIVCNRSGQKDERKIPARSQRSWEWTRKEVRGCLVPHEKLQFPVFAAHGTPVWNIFTSRILETLSRSRKGLPSATALPENLEMLLTWAPWLIQA